MIYIGWRNDAVIQGSGETIAAAVAAFEANFNEFVTALGEDPHDFEGDIVRVVEVLTVDCETERADVIVTGDVYTFASFISA